MSFFSKVLDSLNLSSTNLQRMKNDAEERRARASSCQLPRIDNSHIESALASILDKRIKSNNTPK